MNALDIALVILIGWSTYKGWKTGLVQALLRLAGLVFAYILALAYGQALGEGLLGDDSTLFGIIGIIIVFLCVVFAVHYAARFLKVFLRATPLGIVDAAGGSILGLAQGVLAFGLLILLACSYPLHDEIPEQIENSVLAGPVQQGALALVDAIETVFPRVKSAVEDLDIRNTDVPEVVKTLKTGADDARQKLDKIVKESKQRLDDVSK